MAKRPLHVLTLISAVVCVVAAGVVGRSFVRVDVALVPLWQSFTIGVQTVDGQLLLWRDRFGRSFRYGTESASNVRPTLDRLWQSQTGLRSLGVGWPTAGRRTLVILPLWLLPLLTAILPLRWLMLWRARRRGGGRGFAVVADGEMNHGGAEARRRVTPD